jgi:hypothetical protein
MLRVRHVTGDQHDAGPVTECGVQLRLMACVGDHDETTIDECIDERAAETLGCSGYQCY